MTLVQCIGYLGPPPMNMIQNSSTFSTCFDAESKTHLAWLNHILTENYYREWVSELPVPKDSLEDFVTTIPSGEEKEQFLRFIRKILTWDPQVRATSNDTGRMAYEAVLRRFYGDRGVFGGNNIPRD